MARYARFALTGLGVSCLFVSALAFAQPRGRGPARRATVVAPRPYVQAMVGWHAPASGKSPPVDARGRPMLALSTLNRGERVELGAQTDRGGFSGRDLDRIAHVLRSAGGDEHPMEPRTIDILYRIQTHFHAQEIRVVSGYRTPKPGNNSNHGKGRAVDFIVPGATDEEVAKFAREIGFVGVGIYPTSQFVHVDVRPRSYFWVDYSAPGKKNRERGILGELALWSDQRATARGERGIEPFVIAPDVDAAVRTRAAQAPHAPHGSGDDEDEDGDEGGGG